MRIEETHASNYFHAIIDAIRNDDLSGWIYHAYRAVFSNEPGSGRSDYITFALYSGFEVLVSEMDDLSDELGGGSHYFRPNFISEIENNISNQMYVDQTGECDSKTPCHPSTQEGVESAWTEATINITAGEYNENILIDKRKEIKLAGGWDSQFTENPSRTTINGSMTIAGGTVVIENLILQ
ncbi:MAG: hypothetical protein GY859_41055 [Desulfobacterales bacterium]|nr:hypothetical protein [Desulfobacterales bacterium]